MTDGNGAPIDLQGPLARLWRDVFAKAAGVAEGRAAELVKRHVYQYPHGLGGGGEVGPPGADEDIWVDEAGDTMTGSLVFYGLGIVDHGAIRVSAGLGGDARAYGSGTEPFGPEAQNILGTEVGIQFVVTETTRVVAVRWYRKNGIQPAPTAVRLWHEVDKTAPIMSLENPLEFEAAGEGWKEHVLSGEEESPDLVPGVVYALSYENLAGLLYTTREDNYTPVGDPPLVVLGNAVGPAKGEYPEELAGDAYGIDVVVHGEAFAPAANTGAIRLPNDGFGVIAWRNATDTGDHTLTVNAYGELVYDGIPLAGGAGGGNALMYTQTTAPAGIVNALWFNPEEEA